MKVAPSWTTDANSTMDVTDDANKVDAGTYTCTNLTDVSVRYEVVGGNGGYSSYGHEPYNYNQYKYKQYWDGYYCSYPEHTTLMKTSHTVENEEVSTPLVFLLVAQALTLAPAQALPTLVLPILDLPALLQCPLRLHLALREPGQADNQPTTDQRQPTLTVLPSRRSSALSSAQTEKSLPLVTTLPSATSTPTAHKNGSRDLLAALNLLILWLFWLILQRPLLHPVLKPGHQ